MKFFNCDTPIFRDELLKEAEEAITDIFFDFGLRYDNDQVKYNSRAKNVEVPMGGDPFIYQMTVCYNHIATGVIPTAATDGNNYYWNPHFVLALSPLALRFIIFHEATHAIFNHCDRRGGRDPRLWNLAVDYITNFYVVEDLKHRSETGRGDRRVFTEPTLMIELGNHITLKDFEQMYKDPVLLEKMLKQAHDMRNKKKQRVEGYQLAMKEKRKLTAEEDKKLIEEIKKGFVWNPNAKEKTGFFVDPNLPEDLRTPEQIYDYLFSKLPKCPSCGKVGVAHDKNGKIQKDPNAPKKQDKKGKKDPNADRKPGEMPAEEKADGKDPGESGEEGESGENGQSGENGKSGAGGQPGGKGSKGQKGEHGKGEPSHDHEHGEDGECCDHDHGNEQGKGKQGESGSGQESGDADCDDLGLEDENAAGNKQPGQKGKGSPAQGQGKGEGEGEGDSEGEGEGDQSGSGQGKSEGEGSDDGGFGCSDCEGSADLLGIGDLLDEHLDSEVSQQEMAERLSEAIKQSSKMAGHVPSGMEGELGELVKPVLTFKDAIRLVEKRSKDGGKKSDYTRFKKRPLISGNFIPKRKDFIFKAAILVDTSGSMSDQDIIHGVSQLQNMHELNSGIIIPADAAIYWDQAVKIGSVKAEELKKFKVVGRGGTMFNQFFTDYEQHVGEQDMLIVITDGYLYDEVMENPGIPVIWIVTNNHSRFNPPFGKAFELNL